MVRPPSLLERTKATVRKALDKAREKLRDSGESFMGLVDDPVAGNARLLALVESCKVCDLPIRSGTKRHWQRHALQARQEAPGSG